MNQQFTLFRRAGVFYCEDRTTRKQTSLRTRDQAEALTLLHAKNESVREMEMYLATMIRQVDSSLLDEWEKMRDPNFLRAETKEVRPPGAEEAEKDMTRDTKAFTAAIRHRIFTFLRGLVIGDFEGVVGALGESPLTPFERERENGTQPWTVARL